MKKVIIVDDDANFAKLEKEFVEKFNPVEAVAFSNPSAALNYVLLHKDIDIVITDYEMPKMNGFELAINILEVLPNIRIIVSSGNPKKYLEDLAQKYMLQGKVELLNKSNVAFLQHLTD